jgi:erythromycin esterase
MINTRLILTLVILLMSLIFSCSNDNSSNKTPSKLDFEANNKELEWLKKHYVVLKTVEPNSGFEDLQPLKQMIGDARIVGLGENTHGSSEVFRMKHRLVEFLASEMGFTIFSIEANMPEAYKINEYVHENRSNYEPKSLLKGMYFWTWNTQEVLNMINWMKEFNNQNNGKIQFTGFDMQFFSGAIENLRRFSKDYDPVLKSKVDSLSMLFEKSQQFRSRTNLKKEGIAVIMNKCLQLNSYILENENSILLNVGEYEYKWLMQNARVLLQCTELAEKAESGSTYRDMSMARNIQWILENNPNAKIVLWAHNGHVTKQEGFMGSYLEKKYGKEYYNIGFISNSGTYTAFNSTRIDSSNILQEGRPGSFEYSFHKTNTPYFFFDFNQITDNEPESKWLARKLKLRSIGSVPVKIQFRPTMISNQFDAIIFIDSTHASHCFDIN